MRGGSSSSDHSSNDCGGRSAGADGLSTVKGLGFNVYRVWSTTTVQNLLISKACPTSGLVRSFSG